MSQAHTRHKAHQEELQRMGKDLARRSKSQCELCDASTSLSAYEVPPEPENPTLETTLFLCDVCKQQIEKPDAIDPNHWYSLQEKVWSEHAVVQVMAWRMLQHLKTEAWAQDLLDQLYLEDEVLHWAQQGSTASGSGTKTFDSNGTELFDGDDVHLVKDLDVKGTSFTAKRGTTVKNIRLTEDPAYIEGRINKTVIMLKTEFMKKV